MKNFLISLLIAGTSLIATNNLIAQEARPQANVVIILTDDLGWQDVKCYDIDKDSPYETPNIDNLATKGVMFWEGYSPAPVCSPSRAAILSGDHPARANMTSVLGGGTPVPYAKSWRMMAPYFSGRMPENEQTIARTLQQNGYVTGHSGKWHVAVDHDSYPQPVDQGFDYSENSRGVTTSTSPDRLSGFATSNPDDPYRLDEFGFPTDPTTQNALIFMDKNKANPFFLYFATWLVHTPIHTRSEELLAKYCNKLGMPFLTDPGKLKLEHGQNNPYYCAMVEMVDHYVGQVINYLDDTDDPRWPGHKLSENTYLFFTSDNGGYEGNSSEWITDNAPLDRGKMHAKEGGVRVPFIVSGPGITQGVQSNVMVNGLDLYPTIISLLDIPKPEGKNLDGCDLSTLLHEDATNPNLVLNDDATVRNTMMWHYPHGEANHSTIRIGDYKLIRNYDYVNNNAKEELDLFQLYQSNGNTETRGDIEEARRLNSSNPTKVQELNSKLTEMLEEMNATVSHYNPGYSGALPHKNEVPTVNAYTQNGGLMEFSFTEHGATVVKADLIYTLNGKERYEEYFKTDAAISSKDNKISVQLPEGTTHVYINLIDENNFLVSYPDPSLTSDALAVNPF